MYRKIYSLPEIFLKNKKIKEIIQSIALTQIPSYVSELVRQVKDESFIAIDIEKVKFVFRVRLFLDHPGYSLAPHRDSEDTFLTATLQLSPLNTPTALYSKVRSFKAMCSSLDFQSDELKQIFYNATQKFRTKKEEFFWDQYQFGEKSRVVWQKSGGCWILDFEAPYLYGVQFNEVFNDIPFGSALWLHNPGRALILNSTTWEAACSNGYHGVPPRIKYPRPLVIIDLLARHSNEPILLIDGMFDDPFSYYVVFTAETNDKLRQLIC